MPGLFTVAIAAQPGVRYSLSFRDKGTPWDAGGCRIRRSAGGCVACADEPISNAFGYCPFAASPPGETSVVPVDEKYEELRQ